MKVAIVGSRNYHHLQRVTDYVNTLPVDTVIISVGAAGVDKTAEWGAKLRKMTTLIFPADWDAHGNAAGPIRNKQIVDAADRLVAFWDGTSKGTKSSIEFAKERGIEVLIFKDVEPCCRCDQDGTIHLPGSEYWYCEPHSHCVRCGGSVTGFVPYTIKDINIHVCPCVRRHEIVVHNEVIALKAKRADEAAKASKKRGKTA